MGQTWGIEYFHKIKKNLVQTVLKVFQTENKETMQRIYHDYRYENNKTKQPR